MTDYNEDNDNGREVSNEKLDSLISGPSGPKKEIRKMVNIRKEDVQIIVSLYWTLSCGEQKMEIFSLELLSPTSQSSFSPEP